MGTTGICKNDLKVIWPTSKRRIKVVNADFIFQPNTKTQSFTHEDGTVASDEFSDSESGATIDNESDQAYNHEETNETSQQFDESLKNAFLKEPKYLVFWSTCYFCFVIVLFVQGKQKLHRVRTQGTLLVVTMKCTNKHINKGQPQLMVNSNGPGNILLSGAIFHTGKTFKRILEMFDSVKITHFSRT